MPFLWGPFREPGLARGVLPNEVRRETGFTEVPTKTCHTPSPILHAKAGSEKLRPAEQVLCSQ